MNYTEREAETGSWRNDCHPQCTMGNNQPSFVIIAGKRTSTDAEVHTAGLSNHLLLIFIK